MESVLLFILTGFIIFLVGRILKKSFQSYRFFIYTVSGFIIGAIIGKLAQPHLPQPLSLTWTIPAFSGWMSGILIFWAEKFHLFSRPGIEYIATILLGGIQAIVLFGIFKIRTLLIIDKSIIQKGMDTQLLLLCIIVGFISIFGYSLPCRWFLKKSSI